MKVHSLRVSASVSELLEYRHESSMLRNETEAEGSDWNGKKKTSITQTQHLSNLNGSPALTKKNGIGGKISYHVFVNKCIKGKGKIEQM